MSGKGIKIHATAAKLYDELRYLPDSLIRLASVLRRDGMVTSAKFCEDIYEKLKEVLYSLERECDYKILIPLERHTFREVKQSVVSAVSQIYHHVNFIQSKLITDVLYRGIKTDQRLRLSSLQALTEVLNRCRRIMTLCFDILEIVAR